MCEEAFEPDTASNPADPLKVIGELQARVEELERANSGLYHEMKEDRSARQEAEKRAAFAERELERTPSYKRERDEAIRYGEQLAQALESVLAKDLPHGQAASRPAQPTGQPWQERHATALTSVGNLPSGATGFDQQAEQIAGGISV